MKIINQSSNWRYRNLDQFINKILNAIPGEHLVGLDTVYLVDETFSKGYRDCRGLYWPKDGLRKANIELCLNNIYKNKTKLFFVPFLGKYLLARILLHEVGHHVLEKKHSIKKEEVENFAEQYSKKYSRLAFSRWDYYLTPIKPLLIYFGKIYLKKRNKEI